ncbi:hypothetical protein FALBO_9335 [Fusarium albosuccineum]|uniref:Heterokaryon incompatibility domain-containing protein n=1 Tax=Fusarium albosuccineum TaxID=1237068 RepID=A0A8H4PJ28_9HYPO|nr:hypothetical protein FALBO_9335 [Fusarium albosuccineum]
MAPPKNYHQHQALPPRSIRVIRLQPNPSRDAELRCRLVPVSLDTKPKFWALSYTWDGQAPSCPIEVYQDDGSIARLDITPNCVSALRQLRDATEERPLWVDGICINQASIEERNTQVALMGEIYLGAEKVVVWLGEGDATTKQAIDLLEEIGDTEYAESQVETSQSGAVNLDRRGRVIERLHGKALKLTRDVTSNEQDKLGPLFRRNWFSRMWTVQEVTLPTPNDIIVYCGEASIEWAKLYLATDVLGAIGYQWGDWMKSMMLLRFLVQMMIRFRFPSARETMNSIPGLGLDMHISHMLVYCKTKLATDPKDKVYALYGLMKHMKIELPDPDYNKSLCDIYTEITTTALKHDHNMLALFFAPSDLRRPGLPSWVPDWSDASIWDENDNRHPVLRSHFAATGSSEPKFRFTSNPRELVVHGKIVDTVLYRTDSHTSAEMPPQPASYDRDATDRILVWPALQEFWNRYKIMKDWVDVAYWSDTYPTGEAISDVLKTTLLGDHVYNNPSNPAIDLAFPQWLNMMKATDADLSLQGCKMAFEAGIVVMPSFGLRRVLGSIFSPSRAQSFYEEIWQRAAHQVPMELRMMLVQSSPAGGLAFYNPALVYSVKKCLFRTEGGYLGMAPDRFPGAMQAGDVIALVAGMEMPVVLRRVEGGFQYVSHCYVHGMMHGETWEGLGELDELVLV